MEGINDRYSVELEVLTPLAICSGAEKDWVNGIDFVVADDELYKLDLQRLVAAGVDMSRLAACFEDKEVGGVKELIGNRLDDVSEFRLPMPSGLSPETVKSFVKNQLSGRPIVPGSSIKGAVRSILFEYLTKPGRRMLRGNSPDIGETFGNPEDGTDFMRFLKFSDIEFPETKLVNTKIFNLRSDDQGHWQGGWKHGRNNTGGRFSNGGFNTVYEMLPPSSCGLGTVMLSGKMFSQASGNSNYLTEKRRILAQNNCGVPEFLFGIINEHTLSYLRKEKAFFERYEADRTGEIVEGIESLIHRVVSLRDCGNKSCIFKMSAGSGFHSITGDWQFDDYSIDGLLDGERRISRGLFHGQKSSKSRKIAVVGNKLSLMGFVKMSVADDAAVNRYEERRLEELHLRKRRYEEMKAAEERLRIENEERLRLEQEMKLKKAAYDAAIDEAEKYYLGESCDNVVALSLFKKAEAIWPDGTRHMERISVLQRLLDDEKAKESREKALAGERIESVKAGLSNLDRRNANDVTKYLVTSFKQVTNEIERWLKKSRRESVPDSEDVYLVATLSRIYHGDTQERELLSDFTSTRWGKLRQWCGDQRARSIFEQVTEP